MAAETEDVATGPLSPGDQRVVDLRVKDLIGDMNDVCSVYVEYRNFELSITCHTVAIQFCTIIQTASLIHLKSVTAVHR